MRLLRIIWQDILWLAKLRLAITIPGLIILLVLVVAAWYVGKKWWLDTPVTVGRFGHRRGTRLELWGVPFAFLFGIYILWVIERARERLR